MSRPHLLVPDLDPAPWTGLELMPERADEFSFVVLSDRTGFARAGVFERAVEITNLLRPDFVLQIGDTIEGYTTDRGELDRQWREFDGITDQLRAPFFRTPGNHDVSNEVMRQEWLGRHGALHYHFRYADVLFLVLDTQDPPQTPEQILGESADSRSIEERMAEMRAAAVADPEAALRRTDSPTDWNGTMPANIGEEQIAWAEQVIADHRDVRWTVVSLHMPAWQGDGHPGLTRIRRALGARPYTAFAGHVHNYRRTVIDGREHIRLGPTGGAWVVGGDQGNFDHLAWVTMTHGGLTIANIVLDGVLGAEGGRRSRLP